MTKILLDTDIGTDVDDAVGLAHLLCHPDCEFLSITTVTGEAARCSCVQQRTWIWFAGFHPFITFHDPLAAATLFEPDLCTYQHGTVTSDKMEKPGRTIWQPGGSNAPHQVAITVDVERYFNHFFSVVNNKD